MDRIAGSAGSRGYPGTTTFPRILPIPLSCQTSQGNYRAAYSYLWRTSFFCRWPGSHAVRLGRQLSRPRRRPVRRPPRSLRHDAGRLQPARHVGRRSSKRAKTLRAEYVIQVTGNVAARPEGQAQSEAGDRRDRTARDRALKLLNKAKTPPVSPGADHRSARRGPAAEVSLSRPPPPGDAEDAAAARPHHQGDARLLRRARFHRRRNADPRPQHARRRPRLSGAQPRASRQRSTPCRSRRSCTSRS